MARINAVFNGNPPFTEEEAESNHIETNVNFLEGTRIIHQSRQAFHNAFLKPDFYFTVDLDVGPRYKRSEWGKIITREMNRIMKRSLAYTNCVESQLAATVLHGIGPVTWLRDTHWMPKPRATEDILVPAGTLTDMSNLDHFAVYTTFTAAELIAMTKVPENQRMKGWNMELVNAILKRLNELVGSPLAIDYNDLNYNFPEKVEESFKENAGFWGSDAVPIVKCYDFYFKETTGNKPKTPWRRRIILDYTNEQLTGSNLPESKRYLFDPGDLDYGEDVSQLMHVQFADGAVVPPFRWNSVRSLGYLLYAVCHLSNRLRCKFNDATFSEMLWFFRNVSEGDMERLEKVELHHMGIIPEGVSFVPAQERHQVNQEMVNQAMSMLRQLMAENSATFTQDVDTGTKKEQTATEIMAKVNSSNALLGSMLDRAYIYQTYQYREIARRFATLSHEDCKKFRERCISEGVSDSIFKSDAFEYWNIHPERVMGNGNKMLEIAQADRLMAVRAMLPPEGQAEVLHLYVEANTDDPKLANRIAPMEQQPPSTSVEKACFAWATLMESKPVLISNLTNPIDYIETLIQLLADELQMLQQEPTPPDARRISGLETVIQHIAERVQVLAGDETQSERVRQYGDALGQAQNMVKQIVQGVQKAQEEAVKEAEEEDDEDGEMNPAMKEQMMTQAKVMAMQAVAEAKAGISEDAAEQKRRQKEIAFQQEQSRRAEKHAAEIAAKDASTQADMMIKGAAAQQQMRIDRAKAQTNQPKPK